MRVFVVEDHADSRMLLCMLLEQLGHTVESAASMREGLEKIPGAHCDVLISDIGLPDGDGWELLGALGSHSPPFPIAMSGYGMRADRLRSRTCGFRFHLVKPLALDELERALHQAAAEIAADRRGLAPCGDPRSAAADQPTAGAVSGRERSS